jgi:hypothetical protein
MEEDEEDNEDYYTEEDEDLKHERQERHGWEQT